MAHSPRPPSPAGGRAAGTVPLARALSKLGLASRSEAIALVIDGRVRVGGRLERDPGYRVVPESVAIAIDGVATQRPPRRTIALHKPRGVVTTRRDPEGRPTVHQLITGAGDGLSPIGRLDLASSGLLLCTNDTRFAAWLTDPANAVEREYVVTVRGAIAPAEVDVIAGGVDDRGERLAPASVQVLKASGRESHLAVVLVEGRNREIRRLFATVDREVTRLLRVRIGGLELGDLAPGRWRDIPREMLRTAFREYPEGRSRLPRRSRSAPASARPFRGEST